MKYIAVDDEPMALDVITEYAAKLNFLECQGNFRDALSCIDYLQTHPVDLIFLDINMPEITGIDMLKTLPTSPLIIFTTAYSEYAIEGYQFNTVGYLLKPFTFNKFLQAVNKARGIFEQQAPQEMQNTMVRNESNEGNFWLKTGNEFVQMEPDDILFIKGEGNYAAYHTVNGKKIMVLSSLNQLEKEFKGGHFLRVHKSYIVNVNRIDRLERHQFRIGEHRIPLGMSYRMQVLKSLKLH